ncbi:DUF6284 family protein [Streptomyces sp. NPDC003077]|uniref:DUF6284 family protein n=1 Tax=Streptomyces sp. NPDC003077 TaxID=3154443 RepID=UPI0033B1CFE0
MAIIMALHGGITAPSDEQEPTRAELDAIEQEQPVIHAAVALLDAQISTLDGPLSELDRHRLRRAKNRLLTARRELASRTTSRPPEVGA